MLLNAAIIGEKSLSGLVCCNGLTVLTLTNLGIPRLVEGMYIHRGGRLAV